MTSMLEDHVTSLLTRVSSATSRERFNPLTLLVRREMDLSRLIAWLLDPRGSHRAGVRFLAAFLDIIGVKDCHDLGRARVEVEATRRFQSKLVGRIDIQVEHPDFVVLLENKPFAGFGDAQLERYISSLPIDGRRCAVVALLGRGWDHEARGSIRRGGAVPVSLGTEVRDWVRTCAAMNVDAEVRSFLDLVGDDLEQRHGEMQEAELDEIVDRVMVNSGSVAAAIAVIESRDRLAIRMLQDFGSRVAALAHASGLGSLRPLDDERDLFSANKHGTLRLDIGLAEFDVALEADSISFQDVSFAVTARERTPRIERVHADLINKLRAGLGPGSGQDLVEWYAWWDWVDTLHPSGVAPAGMSGLWGWAADTSHDGLAARFVSRAAEIKKIVDA